MSNARKRVEAQLDEARTTLKTWVGALDEAGVEAVKRRRDPKWRSLNARCNQLQGRLKTIDASAALNEELKQRKAQKAAEAQAEVKEAKKPPKKGKGGGGKPAEGKKEKKPKAEKKKPEGEAKE
jgi:hypothetical protein